VPLKTPPDASLSQPIKPPRAADGIGDGVLAVCHDWRGRNGGPDRRETRFVVDCKVKPVALVGQVKITLPPEEVIDSCAEVLGNERLNTAPLPELPPSGARHTA